MPILKFGSKTFDTANITLGREAASDNYFEVVKTFLEDTSERVSFFKRMWNKAGVDIVKLRSLEDLTALPLMGPNVVSSVSELDLIPDEMARAMLEGRLRDFPVDLRVAKKFTSSGSTGAPKVSFYTENDWLATQRTTLLGMQHVPESHGLLRVFNAFHPGHFAGKVCEDGFNGAGHVVEIRHFATTGTDETLAQMKSAMPELGGINCLTLPPRNPDAATGKGHTLAALLAEDIDNFIGQNIRLILTSGAPRDIPGDSLLDKVWEANDLAGTKRTMLVDIWGTAEVAGAAGGDCEEQSGLHLLTGSTYTEVIDEKTGKHVKDGEVGLVVCTGLKQGSRYIRYVIGDKARFISEPCKCGRKTPRIREVTRVMDLQRLLDGCASG